AKTLAEAAKPIAAGEKQLEAAARQPGEPSKQPAARASEATAKAADQLEQAAEQIRGEMRRALAQLEQVANDLRRKNYLLETAKRNIADQDRLASLGLLGGLLPMTLAAPLVQASAQAALLQPLKVKLALWHGLNPMLALSALTLALGAAGLLLAACYTLATRTIARPGSDWFYYWIAARIVLEGASPYDLAAWEGAHLRYTGQGSRDPAFPYPPWTAVFLLPLGLFPTRWIGMLWIASMVAGMTVALILTIRPPVPQRRVHAL
ncbi:MAG: hypothetical protein K6T27_10095, partial [Thermoleophilum sp.]|nr:hypothetical protein [Thermoleophilum sp.]